MSQVHRNVSQAEFFQVCQWVMANKARLLDERPTMVEAATQVSQAINKDISHTTLKNACEATGTIWKSKRVLRGFDGSNNKLYNQVRIARNELLETVAVTLLNFMNQFNQTPADLVQKIKALQDAKDKVKEVQRV